MEKLKGKRFRILHDFDEEFLKGEIAVVVEYFNFYGLGAEKFSRIRLTDLTGFEEWELIQESVPFLEAVKAYSKGKTIRCTLPGDSIELIFKEHSECGYGGWFSSDGDVPVSTRHILDGKWYIEE